MSTRVDLGSFGEAERKYFMKQQGISANWHFEMPDGFSGISNSAFMCCEELTSIELPPSVRTIGAGAFWFRELSSIKFPPNLEVRENSAFIEC